MKHQRWISIFLALVLLMTLILPAGAAGVNGYYNVDYLESYAAAAYNEEGLGAVWTESATTFKVWSPTATRVQVRLYHTGSDDEEGAGVIGTYTMQKNEQTGVWSLKLNGDYKNVYYTYLVTNRGKTCETRDINARAAGVNGYRSMVVDLDATDPVGWDKDGHVLLEESTDAVIWEVHVRDFSISASSGVTAGNRGKYLAFTETGTTLNGTPGEVSTCVSYLKEMGVNTVHLLPVYDFGSVDETVTDDPTNRNWGYDPINYNVPEGSYSTNPYDGNVRITEFKEMIMALHEAGIAVVMDVVYNHTYDVDSYEWGARLLYNNAFNDTVPGYYHRRVDATNWYNGSGCGNVTASDKQMYQKYMVESVLYWATEYHIDGFRFDLMGCHDVETMNLIRSELDKLDGGEGKKILMYGEPWTGGDAGIADGATQNGAQNYGLNERIGLFCDWLRDAIKGNPDGDTTGWIQGNTDGNKTDAIWGGINANDGRLTARSQTVTYADAHDNLILWDKIVRSNGSDQWTDYTSNSAKLYLRQLRLAETILMVSQGMQFQVAGTEFARTKYGDHNSYNSPDSINAIDWNLRKTNKDGSDYYKGLIAIREAFSPFTDPINMYTKNPLEGADDNCIAYWVPNDTPGEWSRLAVVLNNSGYDKTVTLPEGEWTVLADGIQADNNGLRTASGTYTVPGFTGVILAQGASRQADRGLSNYYLWGWINGADYACESDWENLGEYKFVDGRLTATFTADSYVGVKNGDNTSWYMTDGWLGTTTTSATLLNADTATFTGEKNKLYVPGGVQVNFTLEQGEGDTLILSYTTGTTPVDPDPEPGAGYYLVGFINGADEYGTERKFENNKLTATFAEDSYVFVQKHNADESIVSFMTKGWLGTAGTSATLFSVTANPEYPEDDWNKLYVPKGVEVTFTLSDISDDQLTLSYTKGGTVDPGPGPEPTLSDYYLVGSMTDWAAKPAYRLSAGTNEGEYVLKNVSLPAAAGVKVKDEANNIWYPGGMGNDYFIGTSGVYDVSFYPAGGQTGYHEGYFKLTKVADAPTPIGDGRTFSSGEILYINVLGGPQAADETTGEMAPWWDKYSPIHKASLTKADGSTVTVSFTYVEDYSETERVFGAVIPAGTYYTLTLERWGAGESAPYNSSDEVEIPATGNYLKDFPYNGEGEAEWGSFTPTPVDHTKADNKVILHCWNWTYDEIRAYLPQIKAAGYTAIQTSPAQPHSGYRTGEIPSGDWWMLYQPLGLHIAKSGQSWLGDANDLKKLCDAAHALGIEVIVDVVANHLCNAYNDIAASGTDPRDESQIVARENGKVGYNFEVTPTQQIAQYNPELFQGDWKDYFRNYYIFVSDDTTEGTVRGNIGMPDLKTETTTVQTSVLNYLKELVDAGVDGFRFDAAKHIETPSDGDLGSQFWPTVIDGAKAYARSTQNGKELWAYGEILGTAGSTRKMSYYHDYLDMTEISYAYQITRDGFGANDASLIPSIQFKDWNGIGKESLPSDTLVLLAESHDMYSDSGDSFSRFGTDVINKAWAIISARADTSSLYFARPKGYTAADGPVGTLGKCESFNWMDPEVVAANQFHTAFIGADELVYSANDIVVVERWSLTDAGAVLANANGYNATVNITTSHLPDGAYYDQVTGNEFTVAGGKLSGKIGSTGIAVLRSTAPAVCAHEHTHTVTSAATCTEPAYLVTICDDCGREIARTQSAPALGHVDANKDDYCDRCGAYLKSITVYFVDTNDWVAKNNDFDSILYHAFGDGTISNAWPGEPAEYVGRTVDSHGIWKVVLDPSRYDQVIFNCNGAQTENLPFKADAGSSLTVVYTAAGTTGDGTPVDTSEFYLVGSMNDWAPKAGYKLTASETEGEYVLDVGIPAGAGVKVYDKKNGRWYPDGMGNDYMVDEAGTYHVSFYPGGMDGYYSNFFQLTKTGEYTAPTATEEPASPADAVAATPGAVLSEICGHASYEVVRYYDYEAKVCDCCGKHFDVVEVAADTAAMAFEDVQNTSDYFTEPVYWAVAMGITTGTSATRFSPASSCTRAQVVTFLWRAAGSPAPTKTDNPFGDVKEGAYYYSAVLWAVEKGITTGTSATRFSPDASCTRAQIVTFLYRYAGSPEVSANTGFADVSATAYYAKPVSWAVANGITNGTGNGKFSPDSVCTRAQVVTFLYRQAQSAEAPR